MAFDSITNRTNSLCAGIDNIAKTHELKNVQEIKLHGEVIGMVVEVEK